VPKPLGCLEVADSKQRPLASSIFAPAIDLVMDDFDEKSPELASFIVSVYLLGYCFGPLIIAPLSEVHGRVRLYHVCNVLFVFWTVACALAPNINALIAFRFLAGLAGSCPMTIGAGSITDMIPQERRGKYMASWIFGPLWGPVIGPVGRSMLPNFKRCLNADTCDFSAGGYLSQALGWRWSLWLVVILVS
jgi:MFS family permease